MRFVPFLLAALLVLAVAAPAAALDVNVHVSIDKEHHLAPHHGGHHGLAHHEEKFQPLSPLSGEADAALDSDSSSAMSREEYDNRLHALAHSTPGWPVPNQPLPLEGAILPAHRIISYYGNFYSKSMGVLGQYPQDQVIDMLKKVCHEWEVADPTTKPMPTIEYIAMSAQGSPQADGTYRARMPHKEIQKAVVMAQEVNGIVILDVQTGLSTSQVEVPTLEEFLIQPNIHLALDPEFSMKVSGRKPGTVVGTMDAAEINWTIKYLRDLVQKHHLPPKVLVVHRWTKAMVTNAHLIELTPEVQLVIDADGWGPAGRKIGTYNAFVKNEPVQFTGMKVFYKNDLKAPSKGLLTTEELLDLHPIPSFVQYQ